VFPFRLLVIRRLTPRLRAHLPPRTLVLRSQVLWTQVLGLQVLGHQVLRAHQWQVARRRPPMARNHFPEARPSPRQVAADARRSATVYPRPPQRLVARRFWALGHAIGNGTWQVGT
jgi:hypothetical protein